MNNLEKNYFLFKNKDLILASNKHFLFTKINFSVITLLNFINCIVIDNLMKLDNKTEYNYINYFITEKLIVGDPISVSYNSERNLFSFEGLCIAKRKKKLKSINSSLILRAKINEVGVEVIFFYWLSFAFDYIRYDFKRIQHFKYGRYIFKLSKLYYTKYKYRLHNISNK